MPVRKQELPAFAGNDGGGLGEALPSTSRHRPAPLHHVIPANAGISVWASAVPGRNGDSRVRGNDPVFLARLRPPPAGTALSPTHQVIPAKAGISVLCVATIARRRPGLRRDVVEQVAPVGVGLLDQLDLPGAPPFLELLFARDGGERLVVLLEVDQPPDAVARE